MSKNAAKEQVRIESYLNQVCGFIKVPDHHREDIRMELHGHLADLFDEELEKEAHGEAQEEAFRMNALDRAIRRMGDPEELGRNLYQVHKPPFDWPILLGACLLAGLGVFVMWAIQASESRLVGMSLLPKQSAAAAAGVVVMTVLCFTNYRRLLDYGAYIYGVVVVLLAYTLTDGITIMGQKQLYILGTRIDIVSAAPYLLALAYAGLFGTKRIAPDHWKPASAILTAPALFILGSHSMITFVQYTALCVITLVSYRLSWKVVAAGTAACMLLFVRYLLPFYSDGGWRRLIAFFHPERDPRGDGYLPLQAQAALRSGGWFGQGFGAENRTLPSIHSDFTFSYVTYSFGWLAAAGLLLAVTAFVAYGIHLCLSLRDPSGKFLASGLISMLAFQFCWHVLMSIGLLPIAAVSMPFISFGLTSTVLYMAAVGLVFSVRRHHCAGQEYSSAP